jgi:multicomponent K+:H+ antiporter subunit A
MTLLALALLPWIAAAVVGCLPAASRRGVAWAAGLAALGVTALALQLAAPVFAGDVLRWSVPWLPALGTDFGFRMDGLAWLFTLLIGGISALVVLYAAWYLDPKDPARRFYVFLLLFMGAMLGVVLADNLLLLVVFWELTSLSSFLLIGYWHSRDDAREGARMALAVTGAGGLCLLAGVLLIGHIVGSFKLDVVLASGNVIRQHPLYVTALVLVLLGAFTKSAQAPFHFWLPHAMAAPTPVSAYLHSATMVKAGVFLLARLYPALGNSEPWFWIVSVVGLTTLVLGAYIAIFQHDLKGLLAYSTISHLGLITLLFGLDEPLAVVAGVFHIINHATFKAGLFMSAGIIDHETGTRDMRRINGLMKYMPFTATLGMVAAAAMAGVPLMNGFLSKEMFFAETVTKDTHAVMAWLLPVGATLAGVFSVAYSIRFVHDVFFNGEPVDLPIMEKHAPHEAPFFMRLPVLLLVLSCIVVGLLPAATVGPTLAVAAQAALHGRPGPALPEYTLAVWHGLNLPLAMSVAAVVGGTLLYFGLQRFINLHRLVDLPLLWKKGGRDVFVVLQEGGLAAARGVTAALQSGSLQRYLALLVVMAIAAGAWPFLRADALPSNALPLHIDGLGAATAAIGAVGIAAAIGVVVMHRRRMAALMLLAVTGLVVCLAFVYESAPDLALTQLLVEMVTTVLLMLALSWLPQDGPVEESRWRTLKNGRDASIAVAAGLGTAALVWLVIGRPFDSISPYFLSHALPEGGGANAVNVIIVDFRGFDTLGEITVMGIAALIMQALLSPFTPREGQGLALLPGAPPLMLQLISRLVLPFAVLISIYLYLRGHNLPGGGFIAGLVLALGLMLQYVAHGLAWVDARSRTSYVAWIGGGLLVAAITGLASWWFGAPFLTSTYDYPWLPGIGGVPLASASAFDLGVLLVVTGATMLMLLSIARIGRSGRGARAERWAAPEPARIPSGDRPTYSAGEGHT